jgi:hypothetical protein
LVNVKRRKLEKAIRKAEKQEKRCTVERDRPTLKRLIRKGDLVRGKCPAAKDSEDE